MNTIMTMNKISFQQISTEHENAIGLQSHNFITYFFEENSIKNAKPSFL